jgi:erythromycin esterase-like protein
MYTLIDYLQKSRKRFGIFVGHVDSVQKFKLNGYKSVGYMLGKKYKDKYMAIGTASMGGVVRFVGRIKPSHQKNNTKIHKRIQYDKEPIGYKIRDRGSLQRTVRNMFTRKPYHIFKLDGKNSLYYYTSGKFKFSEQKKEYYRNIKYLDYLIYFEHSTPVHNLVLEETVYV